MSLPENGGSLRNVFFRQPGAWSVGTGYSSDTTDLYMDGARWINPDSRVLPPVGGALVGARLSSGQFLGLSLGGIHAARPPEEP